MPKAIPSQSPPSHEGIGEIRWLIMSLLKEQGPCTIADIAKRFHVSYEAARQHIRQLEKPGWAAPISERHKRGTAGRPMRRYALTQAGDHLFPKNYDGLGVEMIDALVDTLGPRALKQVLTALTDKRVNFWAPVLAGKSLRQRVAALKGVYIDGDPFMTVEDGPDGIRLVERNCPFLNVASQRPALCSVTVSTLQRLLGVRVVREKRFQSGDGCCVFRILSREKVDPKRARFRFED